MRQWLSCALASAVLFVTACNSDDTGTSASEVKDTTPPTFAGAKDASALSGGNVLVTWDAATDNVSPGARILYRIYAGTSPDSIDFEHPVGISPSGAERATVLALQQGIELSLVVRAVDEAGNEDSGTSAVEITLPDIVSPAFSGATELVGLSASSAEVRWRTATDEVSPVSYRVYLSTNADPETATPVEVASTETSTVFKKLKEYTRYYAHVSAIDEAGNEDGNGRVVTGMTLDETAPTFAGISGAVAGGTAALLTWAPATDAQDATAPEAIIYRVYAAIGPEEFDFTKPYATLQGITSYTAIGLEAASTYSFVVRAVDAAGNSDANEVALAVTTGAGDDLEPPVFAGVGSVSPLTARSLHVAWSAATDLETPATSIVYDVWYSTIANGQNLNVAPQFTSEPGATSLDVLELEPATVYYFKVRARDIAGNSDDNQVEASGKTKNDDTAPEFDGVSMVVGTSATSVQVTWGAASDDSYPSAQIYYDVYLATTSGGQNFAVPSATVMGDTQFTFTGLSRSTEYFAVVRARDPDQNMLENTVEAQGSSLDDTTPPVLASALSVSSLSQTQIQVTWGAASDDSYTPSELSYVVYYGKTNGSGYTKGPTIAAGAAKTATISGLTVNTLYYVVVVPSDPSGNVGGNSPQGSVKTSSDNTPPGAVGAVTLAGTSTASFNTLTLSWAAVTDDFSSSAKIFYEVCYNTSATACAVGNFTANVATTAGVTSKVIGNLPLGTKYYFAVRAVDEAGNRTAPSEVTDSTGPAQPAMPTLTATGTLANPSTVTVSWAQTSDAVFSSVRYQVYYYDPCAGAWQYFDITPLGASSAVTVPAYVVVSYAYITAVDGFGNLSANAPYGTGSVSVASSLQLQWNLGCQGVGCHGGGGSMPAWSPATAKQNPSPLGGTPVVVSGNTGASRMFNYVSGASPYMPLDGRPLTARMICNVQWWINNGIPN